MRGIKPESLLEKTPYELRGSMHKLDFLAWPQGLVLNLARKMSRKNSYKIETET